MVIQLPRPKITKAAWEKLPLESADMKMSKCEWNRDLVHHRLVIKLIIHDRFARLKMEDAIAITTGHRLPVIPESVSHQFAISLTRNSNLTFLSSKLAETIKKPFWISLKPWRGLNWCRVQKNKAVKALYISLRKEGKRQLAGLSVRPAMLHQEETNQVVWKLMNERKGSPFQAVLGETDRIPKITWISTPDIPYTERAKHPQKLKLTKEKPPLM